MRKLVTLFVAALIIASCSSENTESIILNNDSVILAFGDSLTTGVGAQPGADYPSVLAQLLGVKVINKGISGEISAQGLDRLGAILESEQPDLVILCHGGNDILRGKSKQQLKNNLNAMIEQIQSYGTKVLLVGVPQRTLMLSPSPVYEELAREHELVANLTILTDLLKDRSMKSDTVHLNKKGYRAFAIALSKQIEVR